MFCVVKYAFYFVLRKGLAAHEIDAWIIPQHDLQILCDSLYLQTADYQRPF
jgi:hypothetical protein